MRTNANDYTFILDSLGSVVAVVASDGTTAASYTYDPYGTTVSAPETGLTQPNIVRFAGGTLDETTGLTKFGERYYDPNLGQFTQQDSINIIGNPSRGNKYAYAGDNPINNIDPTGKWSWATFAEVTGGATLAGAAGGCVAGAVATIWTGPGLLAGCGIGAATGAAGGLISGAIGYAWSQIPW